MRPFLRTALLATSLISTQALAGNFLTDIFSGQSKFEQLLSHVPAETEYLLANQKPMPKEIILQQIEQYRDLYEVLPEAQKEIAKKGGSKEALFVSELYSEMMAKIAANKLKDLGLSFEASFVIYSYQGSPVLRVTIEDRDKLIAAIKRAEQASNYTMELKECGENHCFNSHGVKGIVLAKEVVVSLSGGESEAALLSHMAGRAEPKNAYTEASWNSFLKENSYFGYGDGFVDLPKVYSLLKAKADESLGQECSLVLQDHLAGVPMVIAGTTALTKDSASYEMVIKTSPKVSKILQNIANPEPIKQRLLKPVLALGMNINFLKLRDAMTTYVAFLTKSGQEHSCAAINKDELDQSMQKAMLGMSMGLGQLNSLYVGLENISFDSGFKPKEIVAYLSIGAKDPVSLVTMVGMMVPGLRGLTVPSDGIKIDLPEGVIPPLPGQEMPKVKISRTDTSLNLWVEEPKLKEHESKKSEIFFITLDMQRYYELLGQILPNNEQSGSIKKMMDSLGTVGGLVEESISADERGLVLKVTAQYK